MDNTKKQITANDLRIRDELIIEDDHVNAYLEVWFDLRDRFDLPAMGAEDSVNLYADYYPQGERLDVYCIIKRGNGSNSESIPLNNISDGEQQVVLQLMRDAGLDVCVAKMNAEPRMTLTQLELNSMHESHKAYLQQEPGGQCANFSGMVLLGLDMHGMDFSGAVFSKTELRGCDMSQGRFEDGEFRGACFYDVQAGSASFEEADCKDDLFKNCNFYRASFEGSNCIGAVFQGTNLDHTNLDCAKFHGAQFIDTNLRAATTALTQGLAIKLPESEAQQKLAVMHARHTLWQYGAWDGKQADFSGAAIEKLDFHGKDFDNAAFRKSELCRCDFTGCSLIGADFSGAVLQGCDFREAQCQDADFTGAQIDGCDFEDAELADAAFDQAHIQNCEGLEDQSPGPAMTMGG